ncbi:MAG: PEP-CTERM sorting domain-containing protein [Cyanobacteria bacterium P01_F01_bin.56]
MLSKQTFAAAITIGSLGLIPLTPGLAQAASYTLDFDSDASGTAIDVNDIGIAVGDWKTDLGNDAYAVSDQWFEEFGVTISTDRSDAVLFNTDPNYYPTGTYGRKNNGQFKGGGSRIDTDLLTGTDLITGKNYSEFELGNVLIIQESNKYYRPDDNAGGGTISFDFEKLVDLASIDLLDIDEFKQNKLVKFQAVYDDDTTETWEFDQNSAVQLSESDGDNSLYRFNFDAQGVKQLSVIYPGSGAIAALRWEQEQAPPTIPEPATIVGLLAIAGLGLRRKQQSQTV